LAYISLIEGKGKTMESLKDKIRDIEREEIMHALKESGWIMARAAKMLGITERMIGYKIKKHGLRIKEVRWIEDIRHSDVSDEQQNNK
jgi:Nif-specific regulatory protein